MMKKVWLLPLEKYEERYTEQWYRWFPYGLKKNKIPFSIVKGKSLTSKIKTGKVLDVYGTNFYKVTQLENLIILLEAGKIKDNDIIFATDLWYPGIEILQYIKDMTRNKVRIVGILHAGTWDKKDFTYQVGMARWGRHLERSWLEIFDKVFLGSEFHKKMILNTFKGLDKNKFVVRGIPFNYKEAVRVRKKENIIVFPHRLDVEKRPDKFDKLKKDLKGSKWKLIKTKEVCKTKNDYYKLLGKSKIAVSFAEQETFGFAMLEAMANGCMPLVPNRLSYKTMDIYDGLRYYSYKNLLERIKEYDERKYFFNLNQFLPEVLIKKYYEDLSCGG